MNKAPLIGISRLRLGIDGEGVTTLVAFYGCPLSCAYCLNNNCNKPDGLWKLMSAQEIFDEVKKDAFYFIATNGGITFGGGEPMMRPEIIREIHRLCKGRWKINLETSLNVDININLDLMEIVDSYIVDVKDMNPEIYEKYTGQPIDNMLMNLRQIQSNGYADKVSIRLPLINGYNTDEDRYTSEEQLRQMGFNDIHRFKYITDVDAFKEKYAHKCKTDLK